jgi:hypothetical protein
MSTPDESVKAAGTWMPAKNLGRAETEPRH